MSTNTSFAGTGTASNSSVTILLGRILLAVIFLLSGFGKLSALSGTAAYFGGLGLPLPTVTAIVVGLIELLGGLAILVGFQTRIAAWVLAIFTVATALVAHTGWADQMQMINFMKNLAITGGFLVLASSGAGAYSIDAKRG
ncbi:MULTISPECIES: DoxX family protein [unclassified Mesorhizobium]|uniref:DoxX family protein n=1 Tax=unclassified Mesorhizobium TaxID=325217 RepID=UPI0011268BAB|nr:MULTISPECIES: DoxX family protein [unclassified Mesorhizobium]TPJ38633.1 DoxX family protein [Mesorhizobium sp. B2-6-6]MBZ9919072.1 DoxX family protein [Mesorhizobium sp. BR1-1-7]MBZ9955201.1 DoxX family protein [Mesorhizobium sp. BR1-1-15]MBZ9971105.1 DoxX family protein [Mesorhizobium sp. BR1-1-12]MCA0003767.1 DoxX family protein [Mesorhizobium sp. B264B2A]